MPRSNMSSHSPDRFNDRQSWSTRVLRIVQPLIIGGYAGWLMSSVVIFALEHQRPQKPAEQRLSCVELPTSLTAPEGLSTDAPGHLRLDCHPDP
jgi:hypothetical protein